MSILYVGDLHGRSGAIEQLLNLESVTALVQVGDFGFYFNKKDSVSWIEERAVAGYKYPIYTCLGNHDNWDYIRELESLSSDSLIELYPKSGVFYVRRGSLLELEGISHLFMGGARSTDVARRKEGISWWSDEIPSEQEFDLFKYNYLNFQPNTIVTHEAPNTVPLFRQGRTTDFVANSFQAIYLEGFRKKITPKRWYFGHHHLLQQWNLDKTKFYCCGLEGDFWEREIIK